ncbi:MAG: TRCF domain-containing protein, partial [Flavobacteriaceae bacterium]
PYSSLTADAQKRIKTIEQFAALGSGMQIAMRDLEIRGAGDLLGGEQSGFINEIGFDTYQKILEEAVEELQANEFKSLFSDSPHERPFVREVQLDTDFEALIPEHYVNVVSERLTLYSELSKVNSDEALKEFADRLIDRFGPLPLATQELLATVALKGHVARLGIERLLVKKGSCLAYFIADQQSPFYQSPLFGQQIQQVQKHPTQLILKEKQTRNGLRLLLRINQVTSMQKLLSLFETFLPVRDFSNS